MLSASICSCTKSDTNTTDGNGSSIYTNADSTDETDIDTVSDESSAAPSEDTTGTESVTPPDDTTGSDETDEATGDNTTAPSTSADTTSSGGTSTSSTAGTSSSGTTTPSEDYGPEKADVVKFDATNIKSVLSMKNQCDYTIQKDSTEGYVIKLTTTQASNDPYIYFDYKSYMSKYKLTPVSANTYKYVILKLKAENCSSSTFDLFYCAGNVTTPVAGSNQTSVFNNADSSWQYVYFDLSSAKTWSGNVNGFRFDFLTSSAAKGESVYISSIIFAKNYDEVKKLVSSSSQSNALTEKQQQEAEKLLNSATDNAPKISNTKLTASNEDSDISLWFDHTYTKTPEESTKSSGLYAYQMRLAKNEIEGCQFLLSSSKAKKGLTAELSEFKNSSGKVLKSDVFYGYYFDNVNGQTIADPIPPLEGSFDLTANKSKLFLIKVYSDKSTAAGQYSATLTIKDSSGKEIKKASVYAYVWDFTLADETSCKTQIDIDWWNIYAAHKCYEGDDSLLYKNYYDYLLENRLCGYTLPYDTKGEYTDSRINDYLNNPRVVAFNPVGWQTELTQSKVEKTYSYLSKNKGWLSKAVFYVVDEPENKAALDKVIAAGELLKQYFPNYKMTVPMHLNSALDSQSKVDYFEYIKEYVNIWCPHTFFYNSYAEYNANRSLTYRCSALLEKNLGTFAERMAKEQSDGDEVWWYVTRYPQSPEITLTTETRAVNYRILFWQQKLYNVDGFLYYMANDWTNYSAENNYGWNSKHETQSGYPAFDVYGNGVLVYCGAFVGINSPVGSLRLECVRDGIEDFEYLTMLENKIGKEKTDYIIKQITTSLGEYNSDEELFTNIRTALGNLLDAKY